MAKQPAKAPQKAAPAKAPVKAPAKARARAPVVPPAQGGKFNRVLLMLSVMAVIPFSLPTVLLLFFGLLPTLAAAVGDRSANRFAWLCVGGMNFAGVSPFLFDLWFGGHTLSGALDILTDVFALFVIFGAAGFGWMLYMAVPPVVGAFMGVISQRRVITLRGNQRRLVEQWGDEIMRGAAAPPPELGQT